MIESARKSGAKSGKWISYTVIEWGWEWMGGERTNLEVGRRCWLTSPLTTCTTLTFNF